MTGLRFCDSWLPNPRFVDSTRYFRKKADDRDRKRQTPSGLSNSKNRKIAAPAPDTLRSKIGQQKELDCRLAGLIRGTQ